MAQPTTVITSMVKSKGLDNSNGTMGLNTLGNSITTISTDKGSTSGLMGEYIMGNGSLIEWRVMGNSSGRMEGFIRASIIWIRRKDMVSLCGLMEGFIKANGWLENSMVRVFFRISIIIRLRVIGRMGLGSWRGIVLLKLLRVMIIIIIMIIIRLIILIMRIGNNDSVKY